MSEKWELILASSSPRRKELLSYFNLPFNIINPVVDEESLLTKPEDICVDIASQKAHWVKTNYTFSKPSLIVSADTMVVIDDLILGKPKDINEARKFLLKLSGRTHEVLTGVAVEFLHPQKNESIAFIEKSKVSFSKLDSATLERYLATNESLDKAGAYGIQSSSLVFVNHLQGCYANVVGFPLSRFNFEMDKFLCKHHQKKSWQENFY